MDCRFDLREATWCGIVVCSNNDEVCTLAHGQKAKLYGNKLPEDGVYMLYNVYTKYDHTMDLWNLQIRDDSVWVKCPNDDECDIRKTKDVCAGIGGITQGLSFVGFERVASMEVQPLMYTAMEKNAMSNVVRGDVTKPRDRATFHATPSPVRGLLTSGFPCQPLSSQGDGKGHADPRAKVFDAVIQMAWEQQVTALLLENVLAALKATYVQDKLQKLGWSMGKDVVQTTLRLEKAWPCKRNRWWTVVLPKNYNLRHIPDLTDDITMQRVGQLFMSLPQWSDQEELELRLTLEEQEKLHDPRYGNDVRILMADKPCPCILHSYGTGLTACPCSCRSQGFAEDRLLKDGLRGFYVYSKKDNAPRWLHPKEAALLCGIDPMFQFPEPTRAGLCLVGQCASSIQSSWMGAHILKAQGDKIDPEQALIGIKMWLLRQAHGFLPGTFRDSLQVQDPNDDAAYTVKLSGHAKVKDLLEAEHRLHGPGVKLEMGDSMGVLNREYGIASGAVHGDFWVLAQNKRQKLTRTFQILRITAHVNSHDDVIAKPVYCANGTFVFDVLDRLKLAGHQDVQCFDMEGNGIRKDERLWQDVDLQVFLNRSGIVAGGTIELGLGDKQLDRQAQYLLQVSGTTDHKLWIPAITLTQLFHDAQNDDLHEWLTPAFQRQLLGCVAHQDHWILVSIHINDRVLYVTYWDGRNHEGRDEMLGFSDAVRAILNRQGYVKSKVVSFQHEHQQNYAMTCGTIALMHLGELLGLWKTHVCPDELEWHCMLLADPIPNELRARGWKWSEHDMEKEVRDILHSHGVPEDRSKERFKTGLQKIGWQKMEDALNTKNPWASMKSAGSQPRVNFLWARPDELDKQIRHKAESKYKVAQSHRKTGGKQRQAEMHMAPTDLCLIPGTFATEDEREVTQLNIEEVAANRAGIAFATLEEVMPFLRDDKTLTMDALAILTTLPVPPQEAGLLPVTNLRYPAQYVPTKEAVLIEGSIIQLGDCSIVRKAQKAEVNITPLDTKAFKITVWKDEWSGDWDFFITNPVKQVITVFPKLSLCRGDRCGPDCKKFHAPIGEDIDNVIVDLWGRGFFTNRGKRVAAQDSDQYQFFVRIPVPCLEGLQQRSGHEGVYIEPRQDDGKLPSTDVAMIWLPGLTKLEASHKLKVTDKGIALARFGNRWGIRTLSKDAEQVHTELHPEVPYQNIAIQGTYEVRPLPHGIQKTGVQGLLKQWGWNAKPLQPCRGDQFGTGWLIGAEKEPPAWVLPTGKGDVVVTIHKKAEQDKSGPIILGSNKTKNHLRQAPGKSKAAASSGADKENQAPFDGKDPWGGYNDYKKNHAPTEDHQMVATSKLEKVQTQMQDTILATMRTENEVRFKQLETGMQEIQEQNGRFERWFHEAGKCNSNLQSQVNTLASQVQEQKSDLTSMGDKIDRGFAELTSLLSKSRRTSED